MDNVTPEFSDKLSRRTIGVIRLVWPKDKCKKSTRERRRVVHSTYQMKGLLDATRPQNQSLVPGTGKLAEGSAVSCQSCKSQSAGAQQVLLFTYSSKSHRTMSIPLGNGSVASIVSGELQEYVL